MSDRSFVVVGAGIVGLALARRILQEWPGASLSVLDKELAVAAHQSGHNSGVVHAGVYYPPGSLKARLCTRGRALVKQMCQERALPYEECGKLIVARDASEVARLRSLQERATANGVPDVRWLEGRAMLEVEPHVAGVAALHSPRTAIVDFARLAEALAGEVVDLGGKVILGAEVTGFRHGPGDVEVVSTQDVVRATTVVLCAGLHSDRVARLAGASRGPAIVAFRGEYYRLVPDRAAMVRGLIYPVPDPRYPFLGVHVTRRISGVVDIGPNAVVALAREGYRRRDLRLADLYETISWPGSRRMARRHWRMGLKEMWTSASKSAFVRAARAYVPELQANDVEPAPAGVRAQAVAADGSLVDDFDIQEHGRVVAVRNAPSPAATSSLAIAEYLVERLAQRRP